MASVTVSASPRRATAEPPSGTVTPFAENENIVLGRPPAFWLVKLHSMTVGSNPLLLRSGSLSKLPRGECALTRAAFNPAIHRIALGTNVAARTSKMEVGRRLITLVLRGV